ncbi:MAG: hypothetical protein AB1899_15790 [Pseudomonadota bacterium]
MNSSLSVSPIPCPFCGLLCDDLEVAVVAGHARITSAGCARAVGLFDVPGQGQARVRGLAVAPEVAIAAAASLLAAARRPLIGGLGCDVAGQRAAIALAERVAGVLEHMHGAAQFRNTLAFQDGGWMTTTLSEVRNRADVILFAGTDASAFPRFRERLLTGASQFGPARRRILALLPPSEALPEELGGDLVIPCPREGLAELAGVLRARLAGRRADRDPVAGVPGERIEALLDALRGARYGVLVWNAAELDFPQADLTVAVLVDLLKDLNRDTRWAGLPLGGNDGGTSAAQVCAWQTGYPLRTALTASGPRYDPIGFAAERLLARGEVDALLWISALDPARLPPAADCPVIVLGRADMELATAPDVFIPVAVPGVQRAGYLHRMDGIVALPLAAPLACDLPGVAPILTTITEALDHAAA